MAVGWGADEIVVQLPNPGDDEAARDAEQRSAARRSAARRRATNKRLALRRYVAADRSEGRSQHKDSESITSRLSHDLADVTAGFTALPSDRFDPAEVNTAEFNPAEFRPASREIDRRCLLVNMPAAHVPPEHRDRLAARDGWTCVSVDSPGLGVDCMERQPFSLVMIHLGGVDDDGREVRRADCLAAGEQLFEIARSQRWGQTLMVVFGAEDDVTDELWARQLGVWCYVPGLPDGDGFTLLCRAAGSALEALACSVA